MNIIRNLKIGFKLQLMILLAALFILVVGGVGIYSNMESNENLESLYKNDFISTEAINTIRTNQRGNEANLLYMMVDNKNSKKYVEDTDKRSKVIISKMEILSKANLINEEKEVFDHILQESEKYNKVRQKVENLLLAGKVAEGRKYFLEENQVLEDLASSLRELNELYVKEAENFYQDNVVDFRNSIIFIALTIISSMVICLIFGSWIAKIITAPLNEAKNALNELAEGNLAINTLNVKSKDEVGEMAEALNKMTLNFKTLVMEVKESVDNIENNSDAINTASEQTSQGAKQVSASINQLAEGSTQISDSVSQMADGARQISENADKSASDMTSMNQIIQNVTTEVKTITNVSRENAENASKGSGYVKKAIDKIGSIREVSYQTSETINELGELGSEIEQIVDLIKNIASQTNLLALNAAIEAARAGEHGKGFAVVAEEVKKLATQSAEATDKITFMVKEIQSKTESVVSMMGKSISEVDDGVGIVNEVGTALNVITTSANDSKENLEVLSKELDRVSEMSEEIVRIIINIATITEEAAASTQEVASITEETAANAEEVSSIVEEQNASLDEIEESTNNLVEVVRSLIEKVSFFKLEATYETKRGVGLPKDGSQFGTRQIKNKRAA